MRCPETPRSHISNSPSVHGPSVDPEGQQAGDIHDHSFVASGATSRSANRYRGPVSGVRLPALGPSATTERLAREAGVRQRFGPLRLTCVAVAACLVVGGCSGNREGDALALDLAATEAAQLWKDLGHRNRVREAEHIAATEIPTESEGLDLTVRREPLRWSGRTAVDEQATIDVRFVVTVAEQPPVSIGGRGNSAGQAARCYRYVLELYRYTSYHEIDCPSPTVVRPPTTSPVPRLPDDGRERLAAVLRTATPETLAGAVRAAFPEQHITVDTVTHEGALVAAVGVPAERDCLLMVRAPGGTIESPGYDAVWLEPGEMGCRTGLYVSPPR